MRFPAGIANVGATCATSALLQCLCHVDAMRCWLASPSHRDPLAARLSNVLDAVRSGRGVVRTDDLLLDVYARLRLSPGQPQDAAEIFVRLIDALTMSGGPPPPCETLVTTAVECDSCRRTSCTTEKTTTIHATASTATALCRLFSVERLDDAWRCESCGSVGLGERRSVVPSPPPVIAINVTCLIPDAVADEVVEIGATPVRYRLVACVLHRHGGHFLAVLRVHDGRGWLVADDARVYACAKPPGGVCLVFYARDVT